MKNVVYMVIGLIIGALLTYYFCPREDIVESVEASQFMQSRENKAVAPKGLISVKEATKLSHNWTEFRQAAVDSASARHGRKKDDRSVAWSLEDLETYLVYAKDQSKNLGYDMTGIRVYLGVYGEDAGASKKNLTTMFMVPTGKKIVKKAGSLNLSLQSNEDEDVPGASGYNKGTGGGQDYP